MTAHIEQLLTAWCRHEIIFNAKPKINPGVDDLVSLEAARRQAMDRHVLSRCRWRRFIFNLNIIELDEELIHRAAFLRLGGHSDMVMISGNTLAGPPNQSCGINLVPGNRYVARRDKLLRCRLASKS